MENILKKSLIVIVIVSFWGMILEDATVRDDTKTTITNDLIEKDRLKTIKEKGVITVTSPLSDVSYFYIDISTKKIAGIEADIITEIVKRLGIDRIETKNAPFSDLLENLNTDDSIDIASGGIFITPEREKLVAFTEPLYKAPDTVVVPIFSNINFKDDLKNAVIGVERGTVYMDLAERWKKDNLIKDVVIFDDSSKLLKALNQKINEMKADGTMYAILVQNGLDKSNMVENK